jgi:OPT family oligopeptide transporter
MVGLSCMVCEVYGLQLPWWGLLVGLAMSWLLTFPICAMTAIMGSGPGVSVITELFCGFMFPGKPLANMTFKCYGYMATWQCKELLSDLKLGIYLKIPPRSMFTAQLWGTFVGGVFNYATMLLIINARREYLDGSVNDPSGLWTGLGAQVLWGSALIYGALGPQRMFSSKGNYQFIYWGFLIGAIAPIIHWVLSKRYPRVKWSLFNIAIFAGGMCAFPGGLTAGILPSFIVFLFWQVWLFRYHKNVWSKYTFILSASLDTGAALTGLAIFIFLSGGVSSKLSAVFPSWIANYYLPDGSNAPYLGVNRCGAFNDSWTGGLD